jgi:hypothetical protein
MIETRFFLPVINQKFGSSSKCVDNLDIRISKQNNLTSRLNLRKKNLGPSTRGPKDFISAPTTLRNIGEYLQGQIL